MTTTHQLTFTPDNLALLVDFGFHSEPLIPGHDRLVKHQFGQIFSAVPRHDLVKGKQAIWLSNITEQTSIHAFREGDIRIFIDIYNPAYGKEVGGE